MAAHRRVEAWQHILQVHEQLLAARRAFVRAAGADEQFVV